MPVKVLASDLEKKLLVLSKNNFRDYTIITILLYTGLRVSELIKIKKSDFLNDIQSVKIIGKGNKERVIPLSNNLWEIITSYIERYNPSSYLFYKSKKKKDTHIIRQTINKILIKYSNYLGLEGTISPHSLRHNFLTKIVRKTQDINIANQLAGHSSINTTKIYLHPNIEELRQAVGGGMTWWQRLKIKLFKKKIIINKKSKNNYINLFYKEINQIKKETNKKRNILLTGNRGVGKSLLLSKLKKELKSFYVKRVETKQDIKLLLEQLKECGMTKDYKTTMNLLDLIDAIKENLTKDYYLIIDDVSRLTPRQEDHFITLQKKFKIITATNKHKNSLNTFTRINLSNLSNIETSEIILNNMPNIYNFSERNQNVFIDEVYMRTGGNMAGIEELLIKYSDENITTIKKDTYTPRETLSMGGFYLLLIIVFTLFFLKLAISRIAGIALFYIFLFIIRILFIRRLYKS